MRKVILLLIAFVFVVCSSAFADTTSGPSHKHFSDEINGKLDHYLDHDHEYEKYDPDNEIGIGADVLLHETEDIDIVQEYKYDFSNENHATYTVFKTKRSIFSLISGLFGGE